MFTIINENKIHLKRNIEFNMKSNKNTYVKPFYKSKGKYRKDVRFGNMYFFTKYFSKANSVKVSHSLNKCISLLSNFPRNKYRSIPFFNIFYEGKYITGLYFKASGISIAWKIIYK